MASYTNLNDVGGIPAVDYGVPFANTIASQALSGISPVDRVLMNREATIRGQQMAAEALRNSKNANAYQELLNQQMAAQSQKWSPEAQLDVAKAQQGLRIVPLQGDFDVQELLAKNSPDYRAARNQLINQQQKVEQVSNEDKIKNFVNPLTFKIGNQTVTLPRDPAVADLLKLYGYDVEKLKASMQQQAAMKPTDTERMVQRLIAQYKASGMSQQEAEIAATKEAYGIKTQVPIKLEAAESTNELKAINEQLKSPILMFGNTPEIKAMRDKLTARKAQLTAQQNSSPVPVQTQVAPPSSQGWSIVK